MPPVFRDNESEPTQERLYNRIRGGIAVAVAAIVLISMAVFVYQKSSQWLWEVRTADDYVGDGKENVNVLIPRGAPISQMGDILVEADVVRSRSTFRDAANKNPKAQKIQAGLYKLKTQIPAEKAVEMLLDPRNRVRMAVTIQQGLPMKTQFALLAKGTKLKASDFEAAAKNTADLGLPAWAKNKPEGFLFPETYEVAQPPQAAPILKSMVRQFNLVSSGLNLEDRAKSMGQDPYTIVTIASLIEGEVHLAEYQPMVSRVIYNRLAKKMPLQFDSTVHYVVGKSGKVTLTKKDLEADSPYNTYKVQGLPPGPINAPGKTALAAALNPREGDWLFFVTVDLDSGETKFAATLEEHQKNVAQFKSWCTAHPGRC